MLAAILALISRDTRPMFYRYIAATVAVALAIGYFTLEVRTLYHGPILTDKPTTDVEQYTYSAVWLVFGVILLMAGLVLRSQPARLASAAVVALTIGKVFLIDMSDLEGIFRALSFIGLGVVLVGIGWLYVGMREALSRLRIGVYALDSLGRVVFSNRFGDALLGDGLEIIDRRLRVARSASRESIERRIAQTVKGENLAADPKPMLIERLRSPRPLAVYVLPIVTAASACHDFLTHGRAIVLAIEPESGAPPDPAIVRDLLGLTLAEARVAALIGSGLPPRDAALRLGITEETARTALKRVFAKVGVSRQSELTALLTRLVLR